jgi:hypothetical protein
VRQVSNERSMLKNANQLEQQQLSMPTFTDWKACQPLIDQYIFVLKKVWEWRDFMSEDGFVPNEQFSIAV